MRGVYLASVWLHILAAMTWVGGMVVFVAAVMPYFRHRPPAEKAAFLDWFGPRFQRVSWICFAILAVSGTFNLWARGVRMDDLLRGAWWTTGFGHTFMIKLGFVIAAVGVSAAHERLAGGRHARWMGRALLLLGLAIVVAAVALVRVSETGSPIAVAGAQVQGGQWFVQSGCTSCHSVSVYGIRNLAAIGPDLSIAVEDVPRRFGRSLQDFLQSPTGTMQMVLTSRIPMTPKDRSLAAARLEEAYRRHQEWAGVPRALATH